MEKDDICKSCNKVKLKENQLVCIYCHNAEELRKIKKQIKEKERELKRINYKKNPQPQIQSSLKWQKNNKEKRNATKREWHKKNKEKVNAQVRERRKKKKMEQTQLIL